MAELKRNRTCCAIALDGCNGEGELAAEFVVLVAMGFYKRVDSGHYQMAIPMPTLETVKAAVAKYGATEDARYRLHPEWLVAALPKGEAQAQQARLIALERFAECTRAQPQHFRKLLETSPEAKPTRKATSPHIVRVEPSLHEPPDRVAKEQVNSRFLGFAIRRGRLGAAASGYLGEFVLTEHDDRQGARSLCNAATKFSDKPDGCA
jgi:hypothetical protein